ncbi:MAG: hypothetical protein OXR07_01535, partial [Nitrospira sp.]|nr:hypothetical protein [Nitrospira sp.]
LHRWQAKFRGVLFQKIEYAPFNFSDVIPMFNDKVETGFFQHSRCEPIRRYSTKERSPHFLFFKQSAYNWLSVSLDSPPCFGSSGKAIPQTEVDRIRLRDEQTKKILLLLFTGRMFFTYWMVYGDEFHLTSGDLLNFRLPIEEFTAKDIAVLLKLADDVAGSFRGTVQFKLNAGKNVGSYNTTKLWHITDKSDMIFLRYMTDQPEQVFESMMRHVSQTILTDKNEQSPA